MKILGFKELRNSNTTTFKELRNSNTTTFKELRNSNTTCRLSILEITWGWGWRTALKMGDCVWAYVCLKNERYQKN